MIKRLFALVTLLVFSLPLHAQGGRIRVLVISGENNHDWQFTAPSLVSLLQRSGKFEVELTTNPAERLANRRDIARFQVFLLDYNGPRWGEPAEENFLAAVKAGAGVSVIHAANNAFPGWSEYEKLVGNLWREGTGHGRFHAFDVKVTDADHPITSGLEDLREHPDELYHRLHKVNGGLRVIASAYSDPDTGGSGENEPMILVGQYGAGRVFHTPLGHVWRGSEVSRSSHRDPQFEEVVLRGTEWASTGQVTPNDLMPNRMSDRELAGGWVSLFDGKTPSGWRGFKQAGFPESGWAVEDGALHIRKGGGGGDIITASEYVDFEFEFEWRVSTAANSGVFYRVTETTGAVWQTGPEYQILDDANHHDGKNRLTSAGSLYGMLAEATLLRDVGEYNVGRIVVQGGRVEHWLNGVRLFDFALGDESWDARVAKTKFKDFKSFGRMPRGHLALQDHGDDVWFRSLMIREL